MKFFKSFNCKICNIERRDLIAKSILMSLGFVVAVLVSACNLSLAADVTPPPDLRAGMPQEEQSSQNIKMDYPLVPPDAGSGEAIFQEKCAPCHGASGLGNGSRASSLPNPVPALGNAEVARRSTPSQWYTIVTEGNLERFMPPFESLSDRQRWDVIAYTFSLGTDPESVANGGALYESLCANCHGLSGKGDGEQINTLSSPPPDFSDQEYMAFMSADDFYQAVVKGLSPDMPSFESQLSERERWAVADFLRTFAFPAQFQLESQAADAQDQTSQESPGETPLLESDPETLGNVIGDVYNNSGGELPTGLEVTLYGFEHDTATITLTTHLEDDGKFAFKDVDLPLGQIFFAVVDYEGTRYASDMAIIEEGTEAIMLPIDVYDSTSDASGLVIDRLHYFLETPDPETIRVVELYVISNPSNFTVIPDEKNPYTLNFEIPENAVELEILESDVGGRFVKTESGFADTFPVFPGDGEHQVVFAYNLPYDGSLEFTRPTNLKTNAVVILVPEDGILIRGSGITDGGTRDVEGMPYHIYNGSSLLPGEDFNVQISRNDPLSAVGISVGDNSNLIIGIGVFGLVLIGAAVWFFMRTRTSSGTETGSSAPVAEVRMDGINDRDTAMDAILTLDDLYKAGKLQEEAYLERRAELKARLKEIIDLEDDAE